MKNHDVAEAIRGDLRDETRDATWEQPQGDVGDNLHNTTNHDEVAIPHRALFIEPTVASFTLSQIFGQVVMERFMQNPSPGQTCKTMKRKFQLLLRAVGISQPTWSRIMGGKSSLDVDRMSDLCDKLSLDFLAVLVKVMSLAKKLQDNINLHGDDMLHYPRLGGEARSADDNNRLKNNLVEKAKRVTIAPGQVPRQTIASKDMLRYFIAQVTDKAEEGDLRE